MGKGILFLLLLVYGLPGKGQTKTILTEQQNWYDQGKSFYQKKDYTAAINAFKRAESIAVQQKDTLLLMNALSRIALCFAGREDYQQAENYYRTVLVLELAYKDSTRIAKAYNNVGFAKHYLSQLDSCLFYYHKALSIYRSTGNEGIPQFIKNIGLVYQMKGDVEKAAASLFESAELFEKQNDTPEVASIYNILGNMYNESGYDSLSLHYHNKGLELRKSLNDEVAVAQSLNNLANTVKSVIGTDSALSLFRQALEIAIRHGNNRLRSALLNNIGEIFLDRGKIDTCKALFFESLKLKRELKDQYGIAHTTHNLARVSLLQKKNSEAESLVMEGLAIAKDIKAAKLLVKYYGMYAYLLTANEKFKEATRYYQLYLGLKDSLLSELKLKAFSEAEVKYRTNNLEEEVAYLRPLEKEIEVLNLHAENQRQRLKFQHAVNWGMGIGAFMMFILVLMARRVSVQRKKYNELLALKNEEIFHRVKNNLNILMAIFSGQSRMTSNEELKSILKQNESRIKTIRHLHDRLSREPNNNLSAKIYFEGLIDDLLFTSNYSKSKCRISIGDVQLGADKTLYMGLIINELVTNSIKHGLGQHPDPFLEVLLKQHPGYIELKVKDNGPGIQREANPRQEESYGMNLLYKLVREELEGEVQYSYEQGAVFTIKIPT
jgi:two-component sensor histidine kinase